jgi:hypothetical protein
LPSSEGIALRVVSDPERNGERALKNALLSGNIYVMAVPEPGLAITEVRFWVDDPDLAGPPIAVASDAPWDLAGADSSSGNALAWNTVDGPGAFPDGPHTISTVAFDGVTAVASTSASFIVHNQPPLATNQAHLSWTGDSSTTMTIVWRTDGVNQLRWSPIGTSQWTTLTGSAKNSGVGSGSLRVVEIAGLSPDATYDYQIAVDGGGWSPTRTFTTAPDAEGTFDFIYFGDTGLSGRLDGLGVGVLQGISAMQAVEPDLLLPGGDYAYNAKGACEPSDGRFATDEVGLNQAIDQWFGQMAPLIDHIPMMPTYGNHEVLICEGFPAWADRFETPTGVAGPDPGPNGLGHNPVPVDARGNYSFDVGPAHFISIAAVFDSSGLTTDQQTWLEDDIEDAQIAGSQWIIPYFHTTPISHGSNHDTNGTLRNQLAPIFEQEEIPLVLFTHDQSYERTYPLTGLESGGPDPTSLGSCYDDADGVVWLKVSPSGKHSNKNGGFSPWKTTPPSWVAAWDNTMHHFTRVTASPDDLTVQTHGYDGLGSATSVIDQFAITAGSC